MSAIEIYKKLVLTGKQYPSISDLIRTGEFGDRTAAAIYLRLQKLPQGERPEDWGAFRAGGSLVWSSPESAAAFLEHHLEYWAAYTSKQK